MVLINSFFFLSTAVLECVFIVISTGSKTGEIIKCAGFIPALKNIKVDVDKSIKDHVFKFLISHRI